MTAHIRDAARWLVGLDWLTAGAFILTIGSFLGAVLDSYTSLCVIGGTQGHIGSVAACPDVHGWDTRTFPLSVDMGWGGALLAVIRLARLATLRNWRWWTVLVFEVITAAITVAGNAFHGAVQDGAQMHGGWAIVVSSVASAVPGFVAVGAGFTLSVLISSRPATSPLAPMPVRTPATAKVSEPRPSRAKAPPATRTKARPAVEWTVEAVADHMRAVMTEGRLLDSVTQAEVARLTGLNKSTAQRRYRAALAMVEAEIHGSTQLAVVPSEQEGA